MEKRLQIVPNVRRHYWYATELVTLWSKRVPRPALSNLVCSRKKKQGGPGRHAPEATDCNHGPFLVSGHPFELGPGSFDYCAGYANAPSTGLASFKVTWSK